MGLSVRGVLCIQHSPSQDQRGREITYMVQSTFARPSGSKRAIKWLATYLRTKCYEWNIPHDNDGRKSESDLLSTEPSMIGAARPSSTIPPEESSFSPSRSRARSSTMSYLRVK